MAITTTIDGAIKKNEQDREYNANDNVYVDSLATTRSSVSSRPQ